MSKACTLRRPLPMVSLILCRYCKDLQVCKAFSCGDSWETPIFMEDSPCKQHSGRFAACSSLLSPNRGRGRFWLALSHFQQGGRVRVAGVKRNWDCVRGSLDEMSSTHLLCCKDHGFSFCKCWRLMPSDLNVTFNAAKLAWPEAGGKRSNLIDL